MNQLTRREFLQRAAMLGLSASAVAVLDGCGILPGTTPTPKIFRIGQLSLNSAAAEAANAEGLRQGLRELGYVEGQNIVMEKRYADGRVERLPDLAAELVALKVDVIVTGGPLTALPIKQVTSTIPIVFTGAIDPVGNGLVSSLAHPGGNITGSAIVEVAGKQLELLKAAIPGISRVALIWLRGAIFSPQLAVNEARALGIQLQLLELKSPGDIEDLLAAAIRERAEALLERGGGILANRRQQFVELVAQHRLPAMHVLRSYVDIGGFMYYGVNFADLYRRATATYVDKILKGAKPADLPVEQPTKFEFVINLKTAKALGLTIPQSVLAQATEVIQ